MGLVQLDSHLFGDGTSAVGALVIHQQNVVVAGIGLGEVRSQTTPAARQPRSVPESPPTLRAIVSEHHPVWLRYPVADLPSKKLPQKRSRKTQMVRERNGDEEHLEMDEWMGDGQGKRRVVVGIWVIYGNSHCLLPLRATSTLHYAAV